MSNNKPIEMIRQTLQLCAVALLLTACGTRQSSMSNDNIVSEPVGPTFMADSAYRFCEQQCAFGPRTMNSEAHERCGQWIAEQFASYGMRITEQRATLYGYDGTALMSNNIIASYRPECQERILLCAHWDSRPWADNDADEANWHRPVMAANDGASGVAVMMELARLLNAADTTFCPGLGIDFICFDAEDWGIPQWSNAYETGNSWALGAQHWAAHPHRQGYRARYGILLDMVGGQGAHFYHEGFSLYYAPQVVSRVWQSAQVVGFGSTFVQKSGGRVTDDHVPVNQIAGIPCIDIIPYFPDCPESSFGPTWHTINDDMEHIDRQTLQAVGQTMVQVLWSEKDIKGK